MPRSIGIVTAADSRERSHGQLHIYDGEGKGKSQAALGVVLRTIGLGICEQRQTRGRRGFFTPHTRRRSAPVQGSSPNRRCVLQQQ